MADSKITELDALVQPEGADLVAVVDDVAVTPVTKKITLTDLYEEIPDGQDLGWASGAKMERVDGHIVLTPEASKLVKIAVLRQNFTTDAYSNNQVVLTGYSYGNGGGTTVNLSVTFGITFASAPIVVIAYVGKNDSTATTYPPTTTQSEVFASVYGLSTTGFTGLLRIISGATTAGHNYFACWIAVGTLA